MLTYDESSAVFVGSGGEPVLSGFGVSVRLDEVEQELRLAAVEQLQGTDERGPYTDFIRVYQDKEEEPEVVVRWTLRAYDRFVFAFIAGKLIGDNDYGNHRAFAPDNAITLKLAKPERLEGVMANYQHKDWWTRPHFDADLTTLPSRTVSLLWRAGGKYGQLLPVSGPHYRADLEGGPNEAEALLVRVSSHKGGMTQCDTLAFVLGVGEDPYELAENNVRQALRMLDDLRVQHGTLSEPVPVGDAGGQLRVELNHTDPTALPAGFRLGDNDTRILAVA